MVFITINAKNLDATFLLLDMISSSTTYYYFYLHVQASPRAWATSRWARRHSGASWPSPARPAWRSSPWATTASTRSSSARQGRFSSPAQRGGARTATRPGRGTGGSPSRSSPRRWPGRRDSASCRCGRIISSTS